MNVAASALEPRRPSAMSLRQLDHASCLVDGTNLPPPASEDQMASGRERLGDRHRAERLAACDQTVLLWGDERDVERVVVDECLASVAQGQRSIARLGQDVLLAEAVEEPPEELAIDATEGPRPAQRTVEVLCQDAPVLGDDGQDLLHEGRQV